MDNKKATSPIIDHVTGHLLFNVCAVLYARGYVCVCVGVYVYGGVDVDLSIYLWQGMYVTNIRVNVNLSF